MSDSFDPDDMEEMNQRFDSIIRESTESYVLEFTISKTYAKQLIKEWVQACMGMEESYEACFAEYSNIMQNLIMEMKEDEE
jgi:hypothetical protein